MEDVQLLPWVLSGVASIVGGMASAIAFVYHGRIKDLRETIRIERDENRALMARLFQEQVTSTDAASSVAAVAAATSAETPSSPLPVPVPITIVPQTPGE